MPGKVDKINFILFSRKFIAKNFELNLNQPNPINSTLTTNMCSFTMFIPVLVGARQNKGEADQFQILQVLIFETW